MGQVHCQDHIRAFWTDIYFSGELQQVLRWVVMDQTLYNFPLIIAVFVLVVLWKRKSEGLMIYYRNGWLIGKPCDTDFRPVDNKREKGARGNCWGFMLLPSTEPIWRRPLTRLALHPLSTDLRLSADMTTGHCAWRTAERNKKGCRWKRTIKRLPLLSIAAGQQTIQAAPPARRRTAMQQWRGDLKAVNICHLSFSLSLLHATDGCYSSLPSSNKWVKKRTGSDDG